MFEKKLVIMTGEGLKGSLRLVRDGRRSVGELAVCGSVPQGEATLVVLSRGEKREFAAPLSRGRCRLAFPADMATDDAHFVLYFGRRVLLYGTTAAARMWDANLPHGDERSTSDETFETTAKNEDTKAEDLPPDGSDLFSDIFPSLGGYADNAVAAVNYYSAASFDRASAAASARDNDSARTGTAPGIAETGSGSSGRPACPNGANDARYAGIPETSGPALKRACDDTLRGSADRHADAAVSVSERTSGDEERAFAYSAALAERMGKAAAGAEKIVPGPRRELRGRKLDYYEQVSDRIDKLFSEWKRDETLEKMLPMTKWVRVDYSGDGRYYVVGLVGEKPDYVCYGLPAVYTSEPPESLAGYCSWLPLDVRDPHGKGYWLLCQDAVTGKSVPMP